MLKKCGKNLVAHCQLVLNSYVYKREIWNIIDIGEVGG